jgi:hypothetical protein
VGFGEGAGVGGCVWGVAVVPPFGGGGKGGDEVACALERGVCERREGVLRRGEQYETYRLSRLYINTLINGQWKQSAEDERTS